MARKILVKDNHVNIEVPYDTTTWHDMFDDFNNDLGMSVKILAIYIPIELQLEWLGN